VPAVRLRALGSSGIMVGEISLGAMMFGRGGNEDRAECIAMIHRALDAGVNLIDTADGYGRGDSERIIGEALGARRDDVVVATKCSYPIGRDPNRQGGSRRWIVRAVEASLRRLAMDHVDILQLHRIDPNADHDESLAALDDLVRAGKVRSVGTSGATASELVELQWTSRRRRLVRPVVEQAHYSAFARDIERSVLPACERHRIGVLVYGPLNGGWLAGKYRRDEAPAPGSRAAKGFVDAAWWDDARPEVRRKYDLVEALASLAAEAGTTLSGLALGFALAHPAVTSLLVGPRTPAQLEPLLEPPPVLDADTLDAIDALVAPGTDVDPANFVRTHRPELIPRGRTR
jgi:aryl-alcohol dehydrogenase-like predicted oxidoreductase